MMIDGMEDVDEEVSEGGELLKDVKFASKNGGPDILGIANNNGRAKKRLGRTLI